jgi:hypothetical protein
MKRNSILGWALAIATALPILELRAEPVHPILRGPPPPGVCVLDEQRDEKYIDLLRVSVKVSVSGGSGSGTICHYDPSTGWAHVISCGHLWSGNRDYNPSSKVPAKVIAWYKDGPRLESPRTYDAEALFWSNSRGHDVSLLRFKPDWHARYAPVASSFSHDKGTVLNSMGCDGGREVARYEVRIDAYIHPDIRTSLNSPRPGRSGGGLLTDDGTLVGICWGTSEISSGDGTGFFTPLGSIRTVFERNGHGWLLNFAWDARRIPVLDHDSPGRKYDMHFVPVPMR